MRVFLPLILWNGAVFKEMTSSVTPGTVIIIQQSENKEILSKMYDDFLNQEIDLDSLNSPHAVLTVP